jgi:uncharacterized repeat protein (TIGR04138 family)
MQEVNFEDAVEIITIKDARYPREAYLFVREALDHTQRLLAREQQGGIRHVSGQELLAGIKDYAATQFGPMAMMVLEEWGIRSCQDFGELVFNMVETGGCPSLSMDDITDMASFVRRLEQGADPFSAFLWSKLSNSARRRLLEDPTAVSSREILVQELNRLIAAAPLYSEERFVGIALPPEAKCLIGHEMRGVPMAQFNRLLIESAYPAEICKCHGLLAKTKNDSRADFEDGYDFFEAFRRPFLPPSKQIKPLPAPVSSPR